MNRRREPSWKGTTSRCQRPSMGKFTVYQSNRYITSQNLRSRRPHRVATTQISLLHGKSENLRPLAPPQGTKNSKPRLFSALCGYLTDDPAFLSRTRTGHLPSSAGWYRRLTLEVAHPEIGRASCRERGWSLLVPG